MSTRMATAESSRVERNSSHGCESEQAAAEEIDVLGEEGLKITEGVVTDINREKKEITIKYANGKTETLQMTKRAAAESGAGIEETSEGAHIVVYYADESGRKVAHYFRKVS